MKRKLSYAIGIVAIVVLISMYSFVDRQYEVYDPGIPTEEYIQLGEVSSENIFSQSFFMDKDNLNAINIKCYVDATIEDTELTYLIYDEFGKVIRVGEIESNRLESGKFNKLSFDEITDCRGKNYTFEIKCEQAMNSGIYLYKTKMVSPGIEMKQNDEIVEGTLVMRTITHMFDWETFLVVSCFVIYIVFFIRMLYKFFK